MDPKIAEAKFKKFKCSKCKQEKLGSEFRIDKVYTKRVVAYKCKECSYRYENKIFPKCKECDVKKARGICSNGLCKTCNDNFNLKECTKCHKVLLKDLEFETNKASFKSECKTCSGFWDKTITDFQSLHQMEESLQIAVMDLQPLDAKLAVESPLEENK